MDSQKPNSNPSFPSAPPGFRTLTLDLNQEPCDETPQTNLNHQEQMLTNNKTTNNMYSDLHHNAEIFRSNFSFQGGDPNSRAIVMIPDLLKNDNTTSNAPAGEVTVQRLQPHFKELVRVSDLDLPDQQQLRAIVRKIRLLYNSVRLLAVAEEEKQIVVHAERSDQRAYAVMRKHGLCLNQNKRIIGTIPGIYIGDTFVYRTELAVVGLHGQQESHIDYCYLPAGSMSSNGELIATSVIVPGGYENCVDQGDFIIYSCHGGEDKDSRQIFHQNLAMGRSMHYGIEVRVIRCVQYEGTSSSMFDKVYFYDGLYKVVKYWIDGKSGSDVHKFMLWRIDNQAKIDCLVYNPWRVLSPDISNQNENVGIRLVNNIDRNDDPIFFEYLPRTSFSSLVFHQSSREEIGCECIDGCVDGCLCFIKNGNEFPYSRNGILLKGRPLIFECGPFCRCPPHCRNRVTQKGLKHRLEVFRSRDYGWGVRSLDFIEAGTFICEYTGVALTKEQEKIVTMNGDELIYPSWFAESWAEWGNLSLIDTSYKRPSINQSIPPFEFALDVSRMRNVACYMSHSSTPNVMVQFVHFDHNNLMLPHSMLFAMENIPPSREFSLDYGVVYGDLSG